MTFCDLQAGEKFILKRLLRNEPVRIWMKIPYSVEYRAGSSRAASAVDIATGQLECMTPEDEILKVNL